MARKYRNGQVVIEFAIVVTFLLFGVYGTISFISMIESMNGMNTELTRRHTQEIFGHSQEIKVRNRFRDSQISTQGR